MRIKDTPEALSSEPSTVEEDGAYRPVYLAQAAESPHLGGTSRPPSGTEFERRRPTEWDVMAT